MTSQSKGVGKQRVRGVERNVARNIAFAGSCFPLFVALLAGDPEIPEECQYARHADRHCAGFI